MGNTGYVASYADPSGDIYLFASCECTDYALREADYFKKIERGFSAESFGKEIKVALEYSKTIHLTRKEAEELNAIKKYTKKSRAAFGKDKYFVQVLEYEGKFSICYAYYHKSGYFILTKDHDEYSTVLPLTASPKEIGDAVLEIYREAGVLHDDGTFGKGKEPEYTIPWMTKNKWIAVKGMSLEEVCSALKLQNLQQCDLDDALERAWKDNFVFVTDDVNELVFAFGGGIPSLDDPVPAIKDLSNMFGNAKNLYCFISHRTVDLYGFAVFEKGDCKRAFAICEDVIINQGEATPFEKGYDLKKIPERMSEDLLELIAVRMTMKPYTYKKNAFKTGVIGKI